MMKRRARLTEENDPLTPTDEVLAGFEHASNSGSQEADTMTSQEPKNTASQQANSSKSSRTKSLRTQQTEKLITKQFNQPDGQQVDKSASEKPGNIASQPSNQPTAQQAGKSNLRKSTFQLSQAVIERLDTFHLQLQLEMGKASAPYKEVVVEEAIAQLLDKAAGNRSELVAALLARQETRA